MPRHRLLCCTWRGQSITCKLSQTPSFASCFLVIACTCSSMCLNSDLCKVVHYVVIECMGGAIFCSASHGYHSPACCTMGPTEGKNGQIWVSCRMRAGSRMCACAQVYPYFQASFQQHTSWAQRWHVSTKTSTFLSHYLLQISHHLGLSASSLHACYSSHSQLARL